MLKIKKNNKKVDYCTLFYSCASNTNHKIKEKTFIGLIFLETENYKQKKAILPLWEKQKDFIYLHSLIPLYTLSLVIG